MSEHRPYQPPRVELREVFDRLKAMRAVFESRRSVRFFSPTPVPREIIEEAIRIAGTAPSGANKQPWFFVAIEDEDTKACLREAAEREERLFYEQRATPEWLHAIEPLNTNFEKPHLTDAPWVVVVFRQDFGLDEQGDRVRHYYMTESVGIAVGFLLASLHQAGLCTLTHTPAPMTFLRELCGRPPSEKPFVIIPVGYPSEDCTVPDITRKALTEISTFM